MTAYTLGLNTGNAGGCEDASILKSSATTNYGSSVYFQVGAPTPGTDVYRGLIKFTGMPTGSGGSVTGASLRLTCADSTGAVGVSVRGLLTAFNESQATWNDRVTATAWNVAGALTGTDVSGTVAGTGTIPASGGGNFTISGAGMNALVLSMIEGTNNGMVIYCTDETTANYNNLMRSSQGTDGERPQLTFDYTAGSGATVSTITGTTATEASAVVFTVTMSGTGGLTAAYSWSGTATSADYTTTLTDGMFTTTGGTGSVTVSGGNIVVPSAVTAFEVAVPTTTDTLDEDAETIRLVFGGVTASSGTINDDDAQPTVTISDATEVAGTVTFVATLSAASGKTITFVADTADGTKTAGVDYTALTASTVTFNPGETTKNIVVTAL